ncbi:hypothetical protein CEXT_438191 [Caerostris extrusa]|uniref:Transposase n=1 Tax=Caerostris extrusa TaxID=172846 RepID=A0AAV4YA22_CAEEX|nr:hypothetical protein CEXT_438191 [Caerostris extrusa]
MMAIEKEVAPLPIKLILDFISGIPRRGTVNRKPIDICSLLKYLSLLLYAETPARENFKRNDPRLLK